MQKKLTKQQIYGIVNSNKSVQDLAKEYGCHPATITRSLERFGLKKVKTSRIGKYKGKRDKSPAWKGGKKTQNGYIHIWVPNHPYNNKGYVLEHRLIMEKHLGRYLHPFEIVHHKDGNTINNKIENLELLKNKKEHFGFHKSDAMRDKKGRFTWRKKAGK